MISFGPFSPKRTLALFVDGMVGQLPPVEGEHEQRCHQGHSDDSDGDEGPAECAGNATSGGRADDEAEVIALHGEADGHANEFGARGLTRCAIKNDDGDQPAGEREDDTERVASDSPQGLAEDANPANGHDAEAEVQQAPRQEAAGEQLSAHEVADAARRYRQRAQHARRVVADSDALRKQGWQKAEHSKEDRRECREQTSQHPGSGRNKRLADVLTDVAVQSRLAGWRVQAPPEKHRVAEEDRGIQEPEAAPGDDAQQRCGEHDHG